MGQLSKEERYQIYILLKEGISIPAIARSMDRDRSVIWREIKRNSGDRGYRPKQAHEKSVQRREPCRRKHKITGAIKDLILERLAVQHSPEQISGELKYEHQQFVSHECIYQFIYSDKQAHGGLYLNLRRSHRKRTKRFGSPSRQGKIPNRIGIEKRPKAANDRLRKGDWEIDTVIGKNHQGALVTAVDRKTRYVVIRKVDRKQAKLVTAALKEGLQDFVVQTITCDNGKEFAEHETWGVPTYFCNPYSSWERGTNENTNGLIRQYFPKKTDFTNISDEEVMRVQNLLNHRPRKSLGYKTPHAILVENKHIRYL